VACTALVLLGMPAGALAATIEVNTSEDAYKSGNTCSLREAIEASDNDASVTDSDCTAGSGASNTIKLPAGVYRLEIAPVGSDTNADGDLNIARSVTIAGAGAGSTEIEQTQKDAVIGVEAGGVKIAGVTIVGGEVSTHANAGGIDIAEGAGLTLDGAVVSENTGDEAGGIDDEGSLDVEASAISDNTTSEDGGGVLVSKGATATIVGSSLSHDVAEESGGGVLVDPTGQITMDESAILDNKVDSEGGGGICDLGAATLKNTTVDGNESYIGGGIESANVDGQEAELTLTGGAVSGNTALEEGGGIASSGRLAVSATTISENSASVGSGGGLVIFGEPSTLSDVKISDNSAPEDVGGGIGAFGALTLVNSQVDGNEAMETGGGVFFLPDRGDEHLDIEGSTIGPDNRATEGDGLWAGAPTSEPAVMRLSRSSVSANGGVGSNAGGGLYIGKRVEATLHDVTVAANFSGAGVDDGDNLYAESEAKLVFENTLVANPFEGGNCNLTSASVTSLGGDEVYGPPASECHFTHAHDTSSESELTGAELPPLAENGGPTETMALAPGSLPVDTGFGCEHTDQRGVVRPPASCDAGAYQVNPPAPVVTISEPSGTVYAFSEPTLAFVFSSTSAEEPTSFQCSLDGGAFAPCASPFDAGPLAYREHSIMVRATDTADDLTGEATSSFAIETAICTSYPSPFRHCEGFCPCEAEGHRSSPLAPVVSALAQSASRWREGPRLAHISKARPKPPRGTTFSFTLNEAATLRLAFRQRAGGRSVGGHCVAQTKHNRTKHACRRTVTVGALTLQGQDGADRVRFEGRLSSARKLKPGRYTLVLSASANGLSSTPRSLTFAIVS
jgi:CSLREA domain-containing protein